MEFRDPIEHLMDEILGRDPGFSFLDVREIEDPLGIMMPPGWPAMVRGYLKEARAFLPKLPKDITLRFVAVPGKARAQATVLNPESPQRRYVVTFNVSEMRLPQELREVTYHEAQHLADYADGGLRTLSRTQLERRALAFQNAMKQRGYR